MKIKVNLTKVFFLACMLLLTFDFIRLIVCTPPHGLAQYFLLTVAGAVIICVVLIILAY